MHTLTMRQGLAPSPWKKRVVNFGHLLCLCWTTLQSSPTQWVLAPSGTFGAFPLAPLFLAFVGKCVGVQGYKGSYFLSFYHPALSFARSRSLDLFTLLNLQTTILSTTILRLSHCLLLLIFSVNPRYSSRKPVVPYFLPVLTKLDLTFAPE